MNNLIKKSINDLTCKSVIALAAVALCFTVTHTARAQYYASINHQAGYTDYYSIQEYAKVIPELQKIIAVDASQKTIKTVLENIADKAGLGIAFNANLSFLEKKATLKSEAITVAEAIQQVLQNTDYEAAISETREIVLRKPLMQELEYIEAVLMQEISGTVTDASTGKPLVGANIFVVGTSMGTATDTEGKYSLEVPDDTDSLRFSYIGYKTQTIAISGRSVIDIQMNPKVKQFDELVVTALGITREKRSIGYSTQEVEGQDLTFAQDQNVIGALTGKIAGVQISGSSGASMGGTSTIKIRGINSLSGEGEPLIVVDGTPISNSNFAGRSGADFGNLAQDINPNNIKTVSVLKGPAASALYGIRGQYGVVMITTKEGTSANELAIDLNFNFEMQHAAELMEFQNKYGGGSKQEFNTLANGDPHVATTADESWGPRMDGTKVRQFYSFYPQDPRYGELTPFVPHPDNVKNYFETGLKSNQQIAISGGGENSSYRLSFNDSRTKGVYPNTMLHRNNLGANVNIEASDQWTFYTHINYARNKAKRPPRGYGEGSRFFRQWFQRNLSMKELKDYKYSDGTIKQWNIFIPSEGETPSVAYWDNPYFLANEGETRDGRERVFGDFGITYDVVPGLVLNAVVRGDIYAQHIEWKTPVGVGGIVGPSGYTVGKYENREMNYNLSAEYSNNWNGFSLDATLGANLFDRNYTYLRQATVGGLSTPGYYNINASIDRPDNTSYKLEKKIYSAYGLLTLGYQDTYFIDFSLRNDKSSALPSNDNSYWYPSISGSFVFSELVDWEPLNFGKLRLSYAQAGSDLNPYQTTPVYSIGTVYNGINTLSVPNSLNNPNIKPSFSHSYEAGIDLNFFGRFGISFTYYKQRNENQIIPLNISGASGYSNAVINAGLIENKGIEIVLSGSPLETHKFTWNSSLSFGRNQNKVVRLHPDINLFSHHTQVYSSVSSYMNSYEGAEYGILVGQAYQRDEETGKILLDDNNMPMWTDASHKFGSVLPDFTGGFQNTFNYKSFSLSAMITFQSGGQFFSWSRMLSHKTGLAAETAAINDRGHNVREPVSEGGGVKINGISESSGKEVTTYVNAHDYYKKVLGTQIYEEWVTDASYIKLSEISLGYTFSSSLMQNLPFRSLQVSVYARNPFMIWQAAPKGLNPSELSSGSQDITWTETGQLNTVRTFGINLNLTF